MKAHFDTNVSPKLARAIRALEDGYWDISIHVEVFAADAKDGDWIPFLPKNNIDVLVTADERILKNADERRAWKEAGVLTYFMSDRFAREKNWSQVMELVRWWPIVKDHAKRARQGSAWRLPWADKKPVEIQVR